MFPETELPQVRERIDAMRARGEPVDSLVRRKQELVAALRVRVADFQRQADELKAIADGPPKSVAKRALPSRNKGSNRK